jgi:acetoacetyl-CoA reductase
VHVAARYSSNAQAADELGAADASVSVSVHQGNVGEARLQPVVHEVLKQRGRVDYLVNNAGITVGNTMRKMTVPGLERGAADQPLGRVLHDQGRPRPHA